ncbi:MAG: hypothetical protein PHS19_01595 [Eubacteriales bacterium]|nr:hypothetical protein [Eubacteriales bacterium]
MAEKKKIKLPEKKTMNLYQPSYFGMSGKMGSKKIISFVLIGVLIAAFLGFGVIGRYVHLYNQKAETAELKQQTADLNAQLKDYDSVKDEYERYSKGFMNKNEKALEKKGDVISSVNMACGAFADIASIDIVNNEASVVIQVANLEDVAKVRKSLEQNPMIGEVRVYTADRKTAGRTSASLVFNYGEYIETEEGGQQ